MASFIVYHTRSISLPSRPHPVAEQLEEQLSRLRSSRDASTTSSISHDLDCLKDVYSCVNEFLQLPQGQNAKWVDEVLDGSLRLLDSCSASRDALQSSIERLQDVQSALRRGGPCILEAVEYLNTRKTVKKAIKKCFKSLKPKTEQKDEANVVVNSLKDVQSVTTDVFKSLLSYISGTQKNGWSIVAKLITKNNINETTSANEFDDVDATLNSLICQKKKRVNMSQIEVLRSQISKLETEIQDVDEALEDLFRHLVKTRATLLNILSY